jgi:hypothetical protein
MGETTVFGLGTLFGMNRILIGGFFCRWDDVVKAGYGPLPGESGERIVNALGCEEAG